MAGRLIKYMGSSDVRELRPTDDFGGQLADGLGHAVRWDWSNKHVVDVSDVDGNGAALADEAVELLLEEQYMDQNGRLVPEFKDVTDMKRIPLGAAQRMWRGMVERPATGAVNESGLADQTPFSGLGTGAGAGGTTTGGSTPGD
jgi:hypothetical protein